MSLYESLSKFVGAGLLAAAPAVGVAMPPGAVRQGDVFATFLRGRSEAAQLGTVLDALAQEIWLSQDTRGVPHQTSESHAEGLVAVLDEFRPDPAAVEAALRRPPRAHGSGAESPHVRIAQGIFARASEAGALSRAGLWDEVALYLLDRLFAQLLDDPRLLTSLRPALTDFLSGAPKPAPRASARAPSAPSAPPPSPALPARAHGATPPQRLAEATIRAVQQRYELSEPALARFVAILQAQDLPPSRMAERLADMGAWLKTTREHLLKAANDAANVRQLKTAAAAALGDGAFEQAMDLLKQVRRHVRELRRNSEQRLQEEMQTLKRQMSEEAIATARLGELALARFELDTAAELFAEAAEMIPAEDTEGRWRYGMRQAEAMVCKGEALHDTAALREATRIYEGLSKLVPRDEPGGAWAGTQLALGHALIRIGLSEPGTLKLKEAAAAFGRALPLLNRGSEARRWALAQLQLGHVRFAIAERDNSMQGFADAGESYRQALLELSAERGPLDWALANAGLGKALLAQEDSLASSKDRALLLGEAVAACEAALKILAFEEAPADWAEAQLTLGNALLGIGETERSDRHLDAALTAFQQALRVPGRAGRPAPGLAAKLGLANALALLGEHQPHKPERLIEARAAYADALGGISRDTSPMQWAIAQLNLGTVLMRLGEQGDQRQNWLAAAAAMAPALDVFEANGAHDYADLTRRNLHRLRGGWDRKPAA